MPDESPKFLADLVGACATGSTPTTHIVKVGTPWLIAQAAIEL